MFNVGNELLDNIFKFKNIQCLIPILIQGLEKSLNSLILLI